MGSSRLSDLQRELLGAFFATTGDFFVTGGAALAGRGNCRKFRA